jgi:N-acetylneuraminate synthase/N,N'-diacetyllegionaminate synthase
VKFQTFNPELLAAASAPKAEYQKRLSGQEESQLEMLRRLTLPLSAYEELQRHARARKIEFLSTAFDEGSADFLVALGIPAFKVGSGDLTNHPLLRHVAATGKPVLLSTGMATLDEVAGALDALTSAGARDVALFHCVSNYPTAVEDVNLRAMTTLRDRFQLPTGWSDHTDGLTISVASVALGADLLEKHFTLDRSLPGPDHQASLEPGELAELVRQVRMVETSLGDGRKVPRTSELPVAAVARKSLHSRHAIPAGRAIVSDDLVSLRPGTGIPPSRREDVLGRRARVDIPAGRLLRDDDFVA